MRPFLNIQHDYELACLGNWPKTQLLAGDQRPGFGLIIIIARAKPARLEAPNDEIIVKMKTTWRKYLSDTASSFKGVSLQNRAIPVMENKILAAMSPFVGLRAPALPLKIDSQ